MQIAKENWQQKVGRTALGLLWGSGAMAVVTFGIKVLDFEQPLYNAALIFIVVVLWEASRYGLGVGLAISALGLLSLDYFFTAPYFTFVINSSAEIVVVISFFATAIVTSQIAARARAKAEEAYSRTQEIIALNQLNMAVLSEAISDRILSRIVSEVATNLEATTAKLFLCSVADQTTEPLKAVAAYGQTAWEFDQEIIRKTLQIRKIGLTRLDDFGYITYLPLVNTQRPLGVLALAFKESDQPEAGLTTERQRWLAIVSNQVALVVEHARLIDETAHIASLIEADKLKSAVLASVSHELRTPLTSIKTAVAGLKDEDVNLEREEQLEYFEVIEQEADRLSHLVSNLLDLSRIESGTLKLDKNLYYLPEIVAKTIERLERSQLLAQHHVQTFYAPDLPLISVDYLQIEQVVANLLENSAKYSPPAATIKIEVRQAERITKNNALGLLVAVSDEGIGVPVAELMQIFDKFYRVNRPLTNTNRYTSNKGTGLGLAICKGIIEAHGGEIWASQPAKNGLIVAFWLPLGKEVQ